MSAPIVDDSRRTATIGLVVGLAAAAILLLLPDASGLPPEGRRMAAVFALAIILWVTEAIPVAVTALLAIILQPLFRVGDLRSAFNAFVSPVFFFVLAMFCLAVAFTNTGLATRFAASLMRWAGTDARRVVVALMVGTAATSTIMSDVPACAIFMTIGLGILSRTGVTPGASSFGKAVMVGIPIAAFIGGVATPAGSSVNILGLHFIEEYGQVRVPFVQWMMIGVPMVLVLIPVACWTVLRVFPPEFATVGPELATGGIDSDDRSRHTTDRMTVPELKTVWLLIVMVVLWVLGSWIPILDVALVALAGAIAMFLPGVNLLTWKEAERGISWDTLVMIGGVTSLGAASVETGLAGWLVNVLLGGMESWSIVGILAAISAFTVVIHLALPIGPVVNAVVIPPIALLAISNGANPALYALPVAFTASCAFLLPLDAVSLITFSKGYYRMTDMLLPGTIVSVVWVVWITILMLMLQPVLGFV